MNPQLAEFLRRLTERAAARLNTSAKDDGLGDIRVPPLQYTFELMYDGYIGGTRESHEQALREWEDHWVDRVVEHVIVHYPYPIRGIEVTSDGGIQISQTTYEPFMTIAVLITS